MRVGTLPQVDLHTKVEIHIDTEAIDPDSILQQVNGGAWLPMHRKNPETFAMEFYENTGVSTWYNPLIRCRRSCSLAFRD